MLVSGEFPLFECERRPRVRARGRHHSLRTSSTRRKSSGSVAKAKQTRTAPQGLRAAPRRHRKAKGIDKRRHPVLWTFTIVDAGEVTFDPANSVIPFPNDVVRTGPNGTCHAAPPEDRHAAHARRCAMPPDRPDKIQLICGLNTLDGFSTLAPPISENSDTLGALEQAQASTRSRSTRRASVSSPLEVHGAGRERTDAEVHAVRRTASRAGRGGQSADLSAAAPVEARRAARREDDVLRVRHERREGRQGQAGRSRRPTFALLRSTRAARRWTASRPSAS